MAKLTKVEVKSLTLRATVKLDETEANEVVDQQKVEQLVLGTTTGAATLSIEDLVQRRDDEIADHQERHERMIDAQIDNARDAANAANAANSH